MQGAGGGGGVGALGGRITGDGGRRGGVGGRSLSIRLGICRRLKLQAGSLLPSSNTYLESAHVQSKHFVGRIL